jgi:hypothetical protein
MGHGCGGLIILYICNGFVYWKYDFNKSELLKIKLLH